MKNALLRLLVRILQRFALPPVPGHILVVSTTALGDTLWATPAIEALRTSFPKARIAVLTSPVGEEVLRHNPWTDATYVLREPMLWRFLHLWHDLRRERPETVVILHASQRLAVPLCAALGSKRLVATAGLNKGLDALLTEAVPQATEHEIVRRLRLVERVGAKRASETLSFFLQPHERGASSDVVVLHPGARDAFRRWPAASFAALGQRLTAQGHRIVVTGSSGEAALVEEVVSQIPGASALVAQPLRALAALLASAKLVVTNDTGPAHLACAVGAPLIMLFGCTDPALFGPHQAVKAHVIARQATCTPCLKRKCRRPFCQLQIGPQEVFNLATRVMNAKA